ncbi:MAG: aminodeoxychorismate lyase, partial [Okeania sp. SIO2H7]|nr:aminodeoxychorismate lyase [Okeania sp. SIO2H7]
MKVFQHIRKKWYYWAILPATCAVFAWQGWAWWSWVSSAPVKAESVESPEDTLVTIKIPLGTYGQQIGEDLETAGIIRSAQAWDLWLKWLRLQNRDLEFKAGTYQLSPTENLGAIADKILSGDVLKLSFTIREGWSIREMAEYFEKKEFFPARDFIEATKNIPYSDYPWLPPDLPHLEGFLFPDTYKIIADNLTPEAVINQMLVRFEQLALPIYEEGKAQRDLDLNEWVTLASIVEKEAVVSSERGVIA